MMAIVEKAQETDTQTSASIRAYRADDYANVLQVWQTVGANPFTEQELARLLASGGGAYVAIENETVVGTLLWSHNGRVALLWRLAVLPECRRSGIASALLAQAEADIRAAGFRGMRLITHTHNQAARSLYAKEGWQLTESGEYWNKSLT